MLFPVVHGSNYWLFVNEFFFFLLSCAKIDDDLSRPLHEDLGDGQEASTLDGVWDAVNPIHPLTGLCSLRDDMQHDGDNNMNKRVAPLILVLHLKQQLLQLLELSTNVTGGTCKPARTVISLTRTFLHMLEHGASSLGLGHICHEGLWEFPLFSMGDAMSTLLQKLDQIYNLQQQNKGKKPPYVMPGYQVRTMNYQMRKASFHRLARLDLARQVTASIAAVADYGYDASIKSKSVANESDTWYELPDGTRINIPSQTKYEFGELLFGRDEV